MTATEELRRMLDERDVEWWQSVNMLGFVFTRWYSPLFSDEVVAMENGDGELELFSRLMNPEQAIEATLGRGTCEPVDGYDDDGEEIGTCCSECGSPWPVYYVVRYCPVCGCKVVDDASVD